MISNIIFSRLEILQLEANEILYPLDREAALSILQSLFVFISAHILLLLLYFPAAQEGHRTGRQTDGKWGLHGAVTTITNMTGRWEVWWVPLAVQQPATVGRVVCITTIAPATFA